MKIFLGRPGALASLAPLGLLLSKQPAKAKSQALVDDIATHSWHIYLKPTATK